MATRATGTRFPSRKSLEEFDFDHARGLIKRDIIAHLGTLDFVTSKDNVVFLGPTKNRQDPFGHRDRHSGMPGRATRWWDRWAASVRLATMRPWRASSACCRRTCSTAAAGIVTWIERTYHRRRRQASLGRLTPIEFEAIMTTPVGQAA
jgi:hypothetical protein